MVAISVDQFHVRHYNGLRGLGSTNETLGALVVHQSSGIGFWR